MSEETEQLPNTDPDPELGIGCGLEPSDDETERGLETWREIDDDDDDSNGIDEGGE